jgi:hypothetical protein
MSVFLSFCAFNKSQNDITNRENQKTEEKNKLLRETYDLVIGLYQGQLHLNGESRNITLGLYTLEVKEGTNSSGEALFKPVLKAVYRQMFPIEAPIVLDARFVPETGEISFTNPATNLSQEPIHTINAKFNNQKITGLAKTLTGTLGNLELLFIQKYVEAPIEGDEQVMNQRLREQFALVAGTYVGKIRRPENAEPGLQNEWDIEVGIYTLEIKSGTSSSGEVLFKPVLKAIFKQNYPIAPNILLDVQYLPETGQVLFINSNAGLDDLNTINAKISGSIIDGQAKKSTGIWGQLHLELNSKNVNTPPASDENELNRKIREQYQKISGTYTGKIKRTDNPTEGVQNEWDVEIGIYTLEVKAGTNPSGETIFKPVLKAIFKQNFPIAPNIILDAQYLPETGQLLFINSAAGSDDLNTIETQINANIIEGFAKKSTGNWGRIHLELISKDVNTPPHRDEDELNRKIREQYQKISGTYKGKIIKESSGSQPKQEWQVELALYILEVKSGNTPTGEPQFKPTLKALFKQITPVVPHSILEAQYIADTGELILSQTQAGNDQLNSVRAKISEQKITGLAQKTSGHWGTLQVQFVSKDVGTPGVGDEEDYNRRLMEEYQAIVGKYHGRVNPTQSAGFDVDVKIYIVQEPSGTISIPKLKAYYKRSSDPYNVTDLTMNVTYRTELNPPAVDMSGQRSGSSGLVYFVILNGHIQNHEFKGQYSDQKGNSGPFKLKWRGN